MTNISRCFRKMTKPALAALLCLCAIWLTGCSGSDEPVITVYNAPDMGVDTYQQVPVMATVEPTPIPTADPNSDEDVAWGLAGLDFTPQEAINPADLPSDIVIGYVARENTAIGPYECTERDLISLNGLMFESVVELDAEQKPVPLLADRWVWEKDSKGNIKWTFQLRDGIKFHNGAPLTAQDVVDSYTAIIAAGEMNPYYDHVRLIKNMKYISDTVLEVTARYDGIITLYGMTFPVVQSASIYTATPRGTGPYWLISYDPGSYMRLEANPLWWKRPGNVKSITAKNYANTASALLALNNGSIDMLASRSYSASQTRNLSNMMAMDYTTHTYEMMTPNLANSSLMSDLELRKAIMYAIDHNGVQNSGFLSMLQSSEVPVIPGTWLYETQSAIYYHSPERALQILYAAGWGDSDGDGMLDRIRDGLKQELSLKILAYAEDTVSFRVNAAKKIAEDLAIVGIQAEVVTGTRKEILSAIGKGEFDLALVGVNLSTVPNPTQLLKTKGELNFNQYSDETMDTLCNSINGAVEEAELKRIFSDIQMQIVEDLPLMGFGFHTGAVISHVSLNGMSGIREYDAWHGLANMILQD